MKFDMKNIHTIFEAAEAKVDTKAAHDETGANLDNTLGDNDLLSIFDDICPITGDVFAAMKNAAADPKNLKVTITKNGNGEDAKLFIEAVEFMTFCEAGGYNIGEAAEEIIDTYKEEVPGLNNAEFHVVFPSESLKKDDLGIKNYGKAVENEWPMQLMRGCRRYGLKINQGVEGVNESSLNEGFFNRNRGNNSSGEFSSEEKEKMIPAAKEVLKDSKYSDLKDGIDFLSSPTAPNKYAPSMLAIAKMDISAISLVHMHPEIKSSLEKDIASALKEKEVNGKVLCGTDFIFVHK